MNQPKDICCLCGKGFKVNIKIRLNQITAFADHKKKLFAKGRERDRAFSLSIKILYENRSV
jgi:hypothetical protein